MIQEYKLNIGKTTLSMPKGSEILSVQMNNGVIAIWALVNKDEPTEERCFDIYGNGHEIKCEHKMQFLATVQTTSGKLTWHIFEIYKHLK